MEQSKLKACETEAPQFEPFDTDQLAAKSGGDEDPARVPIKLAEMIEAMGLDLVAVMKVAPGRLGKMASDRGRAQCNAGDQVAAEGVGDRQRVALGPTDAELAFEVDAPERIGSGDLASAAVVVADGRGRCV